MKIGFTVESQSAEIHVSVISLDSFDAFDEMWEGTDEHQGGVTIKNPAATLSSWQYFILRETSLAEWASAYAAQGIHNASAEAYTALQYQLWDECGCTAEVVSAAVDKVKEMLAAVPVLNAFVANPAGGNVCT